MKTQINTNDKMEYNVIFLVDDNPTTCFYNQDVISEYNGQAKIICYENPDDFMETYKKDYVNVKEPVLLLLDINMPQKLGYEVLEELEEETENLDNLHVLMVTSSNLKSDLEKSSRSSTVIGYVEKPLTLEKLNNALKGYV